MIWKLEGWEISLYSLVIAMYKVNNNNKIFKLWLFSIGMQPIFPFI